MACKFCMRRMLFPPRSASTVTMQRPTFGMCAEPVRCWISRPVASHSGPFAYPCQTKGSSVTSRPRGPPCAAVTPPCASGQEEPGRAAVSVASQDAPGQRQGGPSGGKMTAAPEAGTIVPARPLTPGPAATTPIATAGALARPSHRHGAPPWPAPPAWPGDPGPPTAAGRRAGPSSGTRGQT